MATIIEMSCNDCGFNSGQVFFGPTISDHRTIGPALDTNTNEILTVDYNKRHPYNIVLYKSRTLSKVQPINAVNYLQSYEHKLQQEENFCPSCNSFSLQIDVVGMTD